MKKTYYRVKVQFGRGDRRTFVCVPSLESAKKNAEIARQRGYTGITIRAEQHEEKEYEKDFSQDAGEDGGSPPDPDGADLET